MNTEEAITILQGEALATQTVLIGLCIGLAKAGLEPVVQNAFSYAEAITDIRAIKAGGKMPQLHLQSAVNLIEYMREATLGGHGQPKGDV